MKTKPYDFEIVISSELISSQKVARFYHFYNDGYTTNNKKIYTKVWKKKMHSLIYQRSTVLIKIAEKLAIFVYYVVLDV